MSIALYDRSIMYTQKTWRPKMAKEILHYEVTQSYGEIKKGFRFDVVKDGSGHIDAFIREALIEAGFPKNKQPSALSMLKLEEI